MKLAKKMLACVIALALIGCFASVAFAADANLTVKVTAGEAKVGQDVEVKIALEKAVGVCAGDLGLKFDPTVLEFKSSATAQQAMLAELTVVHGKATDGNDEVTVSFTHVESIAADKGDSLEIVVFTFKVLKAGDAKLALTINSFAEVDAEFPEGKDIKDAVKKSVVELTATDGGGNNTTAPSTTGDGTTTTKKPDIDVTGGEAGLAVAAGLVVLAGAAFVVSKKRK